MPKELSANALNIYKMSLVLAVELSTTNTSKFYFINTLLDYKAIRSFINHDFVQSKEMNTQTISHPILVFNIDNSPNEVG